MKKYLTLLLLFVLTASINSCSKKYEFKSQRMQENPFEKDTFLINTISGNETFDDLLSMYQLCRLDDKTFRRVPSELYDRLRIDVERYDSLDFEDLIAAYRPEGKNYFEIGRFDGKKNQYKTLFAFPKDDARLMFVSKKHNRLFYYNDNVAYPDIWMMDIEGNSNQNITNGLQVEVLNCRPLDENRFLIDVLFNNNNEENSSRFHTAGYLIYNIQTEKLTILSDNNITYQFIGIYRNQIVTEAYNEDSMTVNACLVDYNGVVTKTFDHPFKDRAYYNDGKWLLDKDNDRAFYTYVTKQSMEFTYHIFAMNLQTDEVKSVFTKKLPKEVTKDPDDYFPDLTLHYSKVRDSLQFIMNKKQNPLGKITFFEINLSTYQLDSFLLPNNENFYYSTDGQYILCFGYFRFFNNSPPTETKILNVANKQLINLKKVLDLNYIGTNEYFFSGSTNQFVLCCEIATDPKDYWVTLIGIDGSVEQIELPEPKVKKNRN